jgi:hypothetical protein
LRNLGQAFAGDRQKRKTDAAIGCLSLQKLKVPNTHPTSAFPRNDK